MTFPTHVASTGYNVDSATNPWVPFTGQNYSGQFLVFFATTSGGTLTTASTGWVKLGQIDGNVVQTAIFYKESGAASEELSISASTGTQRWSGVLMRYNDADEISGTTGSYTNEEFPDPPQHSLAESTDAIWVSLVSTYRGTNDGVDVTSAPSGYTGLTEGQSSHSITGVARKQNEASSENPGTFTLNSEQRGCIGTFAVYNTQGQGYSGAVI